MNDGLYRSADFRRYLSDDLDCRHALNPSQNTVVTASAGGDIRPLAWDSDFFGVSVARLESLWRRTDIEPEAAWSALVPALVSRGDDLGIDFLDVRISAEELALAHALEASGFRLVDALALYLSQLPLRPTGLVDAHCCEVDLEPFLRDAIRTMQWGRLFADPAVSRQCAEAFYLQTSLHHLASGAQTSVLHDGTEIAGVAIGVLDDDGSALLGRQLGTIWLIIVGPRYQGRGYGKRLLNQFRTEFAAIAEFVEIGTQIQQVAANRLYRSTGDYPSAHALTFHRWRSASSRR